LMRKLVVENHIQISGVIHLAAVSRVAFCLNNQIDCRDVNVRGTQILLECLGTLSSYSEKKRPWLLFTSSREIYGSDCNHEHPCDESCASNPSNLYGETKWEGEQQIKQEWRQHHDTTSNGYVILRLASVYGGAYDLQERLLPSLTLNSIRGDAINLNGGGQVFDFVHIIDVVASIIQAVQDLDNSSLQQKEQLKDELLICSGESNSALEVLKYITDLTHSKSYVNIAPLDTRYPNIFVCNNGKMKEKRLTSTLVYPKMKDGISAYILSLHQRTIDILQQKLESRCALNIDDSLSCRHLRAAVGYARLCMKARGWQNTRSKDGDNATTVPGPSYKTAEDRNWPPCDSDCDLPTKCVSTGACRCVQHLCSPDMQYRSAFPFHDFAYTNKTSFPNLPSCL